MLYDRHVGSLGGRCQMCACLPRSVHPWSSRSLWIVGMSEVSALKSASQKVGAMGW